MNRRAFLTAAVTVAVAPELPAQPAPLSFSFTVTDDVRVVDGWRLASDGGPWYHVVKVDREELGKLFTYGAWPRDGEL